MKKFIKKFAVGLLAATIVVGSSFTSLAATNCLHVRDYGCHNYHHRYRGVKSVVAVNVRMTPGGYITGTRIITHQGECVCGEWGTWTETEDIWEKAN